MFVCTLCVYFVVDKIWYPMFLSAEGCDLACVRRRSEKRLRKTIRTLRKSINREQFHLHFAGSEYELAKKLVRPADPPYHCGTGQILLDKKCGEWTVQIYMLIGNLQLLEDTKYLLRFRYVLYYSLYILLVVLQVTVYVLLE